MANAITLMPRERRTADRPTAANDPLEGPDSAAADAGDAPERLHG